MSKVKLGLSGKSNPSRIEICTEIVKKMTDNLNYPTPNPTLKAVQAGINALQDAYTAALDGGRALKTAEKLAAKALLFTMSQLAAYVQNASGGDQLIILSSGMGIVNPPSPKVKMGMPANLRIMPNENTGEASLAWNKVYRARSYFVQATNKPDVDDSWVQVGKCTRASITITGLTTGKFYWFRVAALGSLGTGPWSEPARKMIS